MAHGGGCGCKLSPAVLEEVLAKVPAPAHIKNLLVGTETSDDAAVYRLNDQQAVIATTDFFTPIVDDPFDFGRIAATNALSDVYAMGGTPIMALAIVGMPIDKIAMNVVSEILRGGASVCSAAGIPIAGGHSIDSPEPIYGLAAIGLVHPAKVMRNDTARPGDSIILGKPLGVGIYSAAFKRQQLDAPLYAEMLESMTQLNAVGAAVPEIPGVHAMTDVTGFGLLGHLLEMCRGANAGAEVEFARLPLFRHAGRLARAGMGTGGAKRNWQSYGHHVQVGNNQQLGDQVELGGELRLGEVDVQLPQMAPEWWRGILCDPQTSGGLLIACAQEAVEPVVELMHKARFDSARVIGRFSEGPPRVLVF